MARVDNGDEVCWGIGGRVVSTYLLRRSIRILYGSRLLHLKIKSSLRRLAGGLPILARTSD